jgi:hypothetical protein
MNFPEEVTFQFIDKKTKKPVINIPAILILYAHRKNNYTIEAKISDRSGKINFTKEDCLRSIETSKKFYLMDYVSTLEDCLPKISLEILDRKTIIFIVNNRKKNKEIYKDYWDCSEEFINKLASAKNHKYLTRSYDFSEPDLWQNKILEIELEDRR